MDSLSHILCVRCYSAVGKDHEVLLCNSCQLWQHRKCSKGVSDRFYLEFYLATALGQKPTPWSCHYCSQHKQPVKDEPESPKKVSEPVKSNITTATNKTSSLKLPPSLPSTQPDYDSSDYDSDSSGNNEFSFTCDGQHNQREGPEPDLQQHTKSVVVPMNCKTIIKAQPIISDIARHPTLYTFYKTTGGNSKVKDSLDNDFKVIGEICDGVATYQCARAECGFKVRVCESIKEFLSAGSQSSGGHTHNSVNSNLATNNRNSCLDTSSSSSSSDDDTPVQQSCGVFHFSDSSSSDSSDDEDSYQRPHATTITKFSALNKPTPKSVWCDTSSSDSDSCDEFSMTCAVFDLLNEGCLNTSDTRDERRTRAVNDHPNICDETYNITPSSPTSTIPALDSSDNEDENVTMATTYQVTIATRNGERDVLTDSLGYTYNIKFKLEARTFWCCTEVSKNCPASVIQSKRGNFTTGVASHNHLVQSETTISSSTPPYPSLAQSQNHGLQTTPTSETIVQKPGTSKPTLHVTNISGREPGALTSTTNRITEADPETIIDVTELSENIVYYETKACLPRLNKLGSVLLSSDGFIFKHKVEDSNNNITHWHCTETGPNGVVCKASLMFNSKQPFCLSTDYGDSPMWLVNREGGIYTTQHNHLADHSIVTLAKVRMMIQRRIFLNGMQYEAPSTIIQSIFQGCDYKEQVYLDSTGNAFLTPLDKDYLPSSPLHIKTLKTFIYKQKSSYKLERKIIIQA